MKKLIVTVATSACNEEENIKKMLESVCRQKGKNTLINEIIVMSDGSTDRTVSEALNVKDSRITVFEHKPRQGKASMLNFLFKRFKADVLVIVDSDFILKDDYVIDNLVLPFLKNNKLGLVAGNPLPLPGKNILESAINNYILARDYLVDQFEYKNSAYVARGFLAYSKKLSENLVFPEKILNDDAYSYFYCITHGYDVRFEKKAVALYRSPQTIKDMVNQSCRHQAGGQQLKEHFPAKVVDEKFTLPFWINIKIMIFQLLHNPFGYILLKILNQYCIRRSKKLIQRQNLKWQKISSTKLLFP